MRGLFTHLLKICNPQRTGILHNLITSWQAQSYASDVCPKCRVQHSGIEFIEWWLMVWQRTHRKRLLRSQSITSSVDAVMKMCRRGGGKHVDSLFYDTFKVNGFCFEVIRIWVCCENSVNLCWKRRQLLQLLQEMQIWWETWNCWAHSLAWFPRGQFKENIQKHERNDKLSKTTT